MSTSPDVVQDLNHVTEAKALLGLQFQSKTVINAILSTYIRRVQDAESMLYNVWFYRLIANSVGDQLDKWGKVLNWPRRALTDQQYQTSLQVRMRAMRSQGHPDDLIQIAQLALMSTTGAMIQYFERANGPGWTLEADNVPSWVVQALIDGLHTGRPAGIQGEFVYSLWPLTKQLQWQHTSHQASIQGTWWDTAFTGTSYWAAVGTV